MSSYSTTANVSKPQYPYISRLSTCTVIISTWHHFVFYPTPIQTRVYPTQLATKRKYKYTKRRKRVDRSEKKGGEKMQTAKDVAASAKSGMEKTKATAQEKAERMTTRDPLKKEMATDKKEDRVAAAEMEKRNEQARNAAAKHGGTTTTAGGTTTGTTTGYGTGTTGYGTGTTGYGTGTGTGTGPNTTY